jgi:nucleoside-diphosphate-sugar epimerase
MRKVLVTGASGFIGKSVIRYMRNKKHNFSAIVRNVNDYIKQEECIQLDLTVPTSITMLDLTGFTSVIHLASPVHSKEDSPDECKKLILDATLDLARHAFSSGVNRFIYISTIGVTGNYKSIPVDESSPRRPYNCYSFYKSEAEKRLLTLAEEMGGDVVIIRPPMVYGPGAPGNFHKLLKWVKRSLPLPLGGVNNKRSFVALDNLVDFILLCEDKSISPNASNQIFLISDGEDVSTSILLKKVARAYGLKLRLFPFPTALMKIFATVIGKRDMFCSLFESLQIDLSKARDLLGWKPVVTLDEQLQKIAEFDNKAKKL